MKEAIAIIRLLPTFRGTPRIAGDAIDYGAIEVQQQNAVTKIYADAAATNAWADGTSWDQAFSDLQDALDCKCNDNGNITIPGEIWVAEGTYTPINRSWRHFNLNNNQKLYGGFQSGATSLEERVIDYENMQTILSGELEDGERAIHVVVANNNTGAEINGFIIEKGKADDLGGNQVGIMSGGGMVINNGSATLKNVWVRDNVSGNPGEYVQGQSFGTGFGGGIYVGKNSVVANSDTGIIMENVRISNNIGNGGGISFNNITPSNNFNSTLKNVEIYGNLSTPFFASITGYGGGGAIRVDGKFNLDIEDFYIADNNGNWLGGAILVNSNSGTVNLKRGIFENNGSLLEGAGGVLYSSTVPANTVNFESVAFINNKSEHGILYADSANFNLVNCTFSGNEAAEESNLFSITYGSAVSLKNSIITSPDNGLPFVFLSQGNGSISAENCLFKGIVPAEITNLGNLIAETDPMFIDAANGNYQLQANSPAVDAGVNSYLSLSPEFDAAGNPRISHNTVDLGAYEYQFPLSTQQNTTNASVKLYPNPGSDFVNLISEKPTAKGVVAIYNMQGTIVYKQVLESDVLQNGIRIETAEWASGIYIVKCKTDSGTETFKYIKL